MRLKEELQKELRSLNVPLAGKTCTTNDNYDAWFIGFSSNLVVGVYIGYSPKTLGKFETGIKAAALLYCGTFCRKCTSSKRDFNDFKIRLKIYF